MLLLRKVPLFALASVLAFGGFTTGDEAEEIGRTGQARTPVEAFLECSTCLNAGWTHSFLNNCCSPDGSTCFECPFCHLYTDLGTCWFAGHNLCGVEQHEDLDSTLEVAK